MRTTKHADSRRWRASRGFSLAEVLVAVALLLVILLALFSLISAGVQRAYSGKKMTQATATAQAVMERLNVYAPQDVVGGTSTTTRSVTWTKTGTTVTPAVEGGVAGTLTFERDEIRKLLLNSDLPSTAANPARLTITTTAKPAGDTFATCPIVQIQVDLSWVEWGTRPRTVRLQAFNLPSNPNP